jgi:membrane protein
MRIKTFWSVTRGTLQDWWGDNCLRLAASLAPLVLLVVGLAGMLVERQQVAHQLAAQIEGLMGPAGRELVNSIVTTTTPQGGTWATVFGLIALLIGATAVFGELQATMNFI